MGGHCWASFRRGLQVKTRSRQAADREVVPSVSCQLSHPKPPCSQQPRDKPSLVWSLSTGPWLLVAVPREPSLFDLAGFVSTRFCFTQGLPTELDQFTTLDMADPLSMTAGVVGIVTAALQTTALFMANLQRLAEAPAMIESLKQDIAVLTGTLEALAHLESAQWRALGTTVIEQSKATVVSCTLSCDKYMADLQHWTRHSSPSRGVAVRDRLALALWRESQIKTMSEQLQKYRTTLNLVISTASL